MHPAATELGEQLCGVLGDDQFPPLVSVPSAMLGGKAGGDARQARQDLLAGRRTDQKVRGPSSFGLALTTPALARPFLPRTGSAHLRDRPRHAAEQAARENALVKEVMP